MDTLLNEHFEYIPTKTLSNLRGILIKRLGVLGLECYTNRIMQKRQNNNILVALALLLIWTCRIGISTELV